MDHSPRLLTGAAKILWGSGIQRPTLEPCISPTTARCRRKRSGPGASMPMASIGAARFPITTAPTWRFKPGSFENQKLFGFRRPGKNIVFGEFWWRVGEREEIQGGILAGVFHWGE